MPKKILELVAENTKLKAEVERLTVNMNVYGLTVKRLIEELKTAKSEARKEFAEELRSKARKYTEYDEGGWGMDVYAIEVAEIDNLLKEMESKRNAE